MDRNAPLRKPHASTADLLSWPENPPHEPSSIESSTPVLRQSIRTRQVEIFLHPALISALLSIFLAILGFCLLKTCSLLAGSALCFSEGGRAKKRPRACWTGRIRTCKLNSRFLMNRSSFRIGDGGRWNAILRESVFSALVRVWDLCFSSSLNPCDLLLVLRFCFFKLSCE